MQLFQQLVRSNYGQLNAACGLDTGYTHPPVLLALANTLHHQTAKSCLYSTAGALKSHRQHQVTSLLKNLCKWHPVESPCREVDRVTLSAGKHCILKWSETSATLYPWQITFTSQCFKTLFYGETVDSRSNFMLAIFHRNRYHKFMHKTCLVYGHCKVVGTSMGKTAKKANVYTGCRRWSQWYHRDAREHCVDIGKVHTALPCNLYGYINV